MAKISKETRMRVANMVKDMSQQAIVKELCISRSDISKILSEFQGIAEPISASTPQMNVRV